MDMKKWSLILLLCFLVTGMIFFEPVQPMGQEKKEMETDPEKQALDNLNKRITEVKRYAVRKNGVLLQAKAEVKKTPKGSSILIHWTMDYAGPRFPLHILEPTLGYGYYGQCGVSLFLINEKKHLQEITIQPKPFPEILPPSVKESFLKINKNEVAKGTLEVPLFVSEKEVLKNFYIKDGRGKFLDKIPKFSGRLLYMQLQHSPYERGENLSLDAWTGSIITELIQVTIDANLEY